MTNVKDLGHCGPESCEFVLTVDKAGLVCSNKSVDELLIRALTAGVRRSLGGSGF